MGDYTDRIENYAILYPRLFSGNPFDVGHPPGWNSLVAELMSEIEKINENLPQEEWATVAQIKEKFGGLRFYMNSYPKQYSEEIDKLIDAAEDTSVVTCVVCGAQGKMCNNGWISPYCDQHWPEIEPQPSNKVRRGPDD